MNQGMHHYMGIDIGTSGCKAVIFDEHGHQKALEYREYDIIAQQPGWAELDTDEVMRKCFEVIGKAASSLPDGSLKGIGISSQGEAFTLIDNKGKALCNALVSSDSRASGMISEFTEYFDEQRLYEITGHTPHPMFSLFKLLWIKKNRPEIWSGATGILCFEDLLQYRLGIKKPSIGWSLAGRTMLFDVVNHKWSGAILDQTGISTEQLSRPLQSGTIAGYVNNEIAGKLNLPSDTFIVTGGHDQPCSGLGAGAIEPGIAVYSLGTVECLTAAFSKPVFSAALRKNNLCTYDHAAPGLYSTIAFSITGGNLLKWFRNEFGKREFELSSAKNADSYKMLLGEMPDAPTRLLVLPYFTPSGTPYFDVLVRGAVFGLDLSTTRGEVLKALLEGVTYEIKLNLDILQQSGCVVNELRAIGGGTRSLKILKLKADILGKPVTVPDVTEAGCLGVAILARAAHTGEDVTSIAQSWIRPALRIEPEGGSVYEDKFYFYKKLYPGVKEMLYKK